MKRPLPTSFECGDCHGEGLTMDEDFDDGGRIYAATVICEGCAGCGRLSNCARCDAVMAGSTAELVGYICAGCVEQIDRSDQAEPRRRFVA